MPTLSDSRRKRIQARQRKALNALKRVEKIAKRERNTAAHPVSHPAAKSAR